jgi:hypothetical protein
MPEAADVQAAVEIAEASRWHLLYRIAGICAILTAVIAIPISMVGYTLWPPPDTVEELYNLYQANRLAGIMASDVTYMLANVVLVVPIFLGLYLALRRTSESVMLLATAFGLVGVVAIIPARQTVELMLLSDQFAAATGEVQRAAYLAVGEALWASLSGTAYQVHLIVGALAIIVISIVMLRTNVFNKAVAWSGLVSNLCSLGYYVPVIGTVLLLFSVLLLWIWSILLGIAFLRLARDGARAVESP